MSKNKLKKEVAVPAVAETQEAQVTETVLEVVVPAVAQTQPYNQAVDLLQVAFVYFNRELCNNELDQVPVITIQSKGRRAAFGWFWDCTWTNGADEVLRPEINIAAEYLSRTALNIFETLIHEMVHMVNAKRKTKDCNSAQYHNMRFKATAEALGLTCEKMGTYGYAKTALGETARAVVETFIQNNNCSVFDSFNRVNRKRDWKKVHTIPCTEEAKNQIERLALDQLKSQKEVVNMLLSHYTNHVGVEELAPVVDAGE